MSSSSLARSLDPLAQHLEDLRLRPAVDEDDEAEAEPLLVLGVQARELGEHLRVGVVALLGGGARARGPSARRSPGARRAPRASRPPVELGDHGLARVPSGSSRVREPLDEARAALEELGELVRRSAAAVGRARVGGDEERDVVVAVLELDLELDARKNGEGGWKTRR